MPTWEECVAAVSKAAGKELTGPQVARILEATDQKSRALQRRGMSNLDATRQAAEELAAERRLAAKIEKRNALINASVRMDLEARIIPGQELNSVYAIPGGVEGKFRNAAHSVDANGQRATERAWGAVINDLDQLGLTKAFKNADVEFQRRVATEMQRQRDPATLPATGDRHAENIAKVLAKHQELTRLFLNDAGAFIRKADDYIARQSHDQGKVLSAGFDAWRADIEPRLDWDRTAPDIEPGERAGFLRKVWEHLATRKFEATESDWLKGFDGAGNVAKKVSAERVLNFLPGQWFDYHQKYGTSTLFETVMRGIERGQRTGEAMKMLGTNPELMYQTIVGKAADAADARGDTKMAAEIVAKAGKFSRILEHAMQKTAPPENMTSAKRWAFARSMQTYKLGASVISSLSDMAAIAANARHNGIGAFESMANGFARLFPNTPEGRAHAQEAGVGIDGMMRHTASRFMASDDQLSARNAKYVDMFMRWSGQNHWTDSMKAGHGEMLMFNLARNATKDFAGLDRRFQNTLARYGIEDAEWQAIRLASEKGPDGNGYIDAGGILKLPDDAVEHLRNGRHTHDFVRSDLADKVSTYVHDNVQEAMSERNARVSEMMLGGNAAGTLKGEGLRSFWQFKSFTVSFMMRSLQREIYRDGVDVGGLAKMFVGMTAFGYLAHSLKEISRGKYPRGPLAPNPQSMEDYGKTLLAAMAQGGGLGIYGDFLFGQQTRHGQSPQAALAGPLAGEVEDVLKVLQTAVDVGLRKALDGGARPAQWKDVGSAAFDFVRSNVPPFSATNLFYTRAAADYMIYFQIQEALNPGWKQRYERRIQRENNQQFWLSPTTGRLQ